MKRKYKLGTDSLHPLYQAWNGMRQRCFNKNRVDYPNYGGRGITIAERWLNFENFVEDMNVDYKKGLTIERINVNADYSQENCKWATRKEQNNNKRNNHLIEYKGIADTLTNWAKYLGIKRSTLDQRFYVYKWNIEKCLTYGRSKSTWA